MKKPNKLREARLNKIRFRKNNKRKEKVRLKKNSMHSYGLREKWSYFAVLET